MFAGDPFITGYFNRTLHLDIGQNNALYMSELINILSN